MQRTYRVPRAWAGLVGLVALLVLLACPGTSIAGGASQSTQPGGDSARALLQQGAGYGATKAEAASVRSLQRQLRSLGWQPGPVDGLFGPRTEAAVLRFQNQTGLAVDGIVGPQTTKALDRARTSPLREGVGYAEPNGSPRVRTLQSRLRNQGLRPGPVDGVFGPRTEAAVRRFQKQGRLPANGVATRRIVRQLADAGPGRQNAPAPATGDPKPEERRPAATPDRPDRPRNTAPVIPVSVTEDDSGSVEIPVLLIIALLALLVGALGGLLLGGSRPGLSGPPMPMADSVVAEGWTHTRSIGPFRGHVLALAVGREGLRRRSVTRYLVSDPRTKGPFWVTQEEVSKLIRPLVGPAPPVEEPLPPSERAPLGEVRVLGYVSVRNPAEFESIHLQEQADAIAAHCSARGWTLLEVVRDVNGTGAAVLDRPGLRYALDRIGKGEASCLAVAQLGQLSHSAADLGRVVDAVRQVRGRLVALDVDLDTAAHDAQVAVNALVAVGDWGASPSEERPQTRVAALRATRPGATQRQVDDPGAVRERIARMRADGMTLQAIADRLNEEGVPTLGGGTHWRPSSVRYAAGSTHPPEGASA
jgi:peptidoglycan hydrolase-like protein with peptidoglycan-binding domain